MDINMPEIDGITITRRLRKTHPKTKVIAFSSHSTRICILNMLRAGAAGYVLKGSPANELSKAIRTALEGHVHMSPGTHSILIDELLAIDKKKSGYNQYSVLEPSGSGH